MEQEMDDLVLEAGDIISVLYESSYFERNTLIKKGQEFISVSKIRNVLIESSDVKSNSKYSLQFYSGATVELDSIREVHSIKGDLIYKKGLNTLKILLNDERVIGVLDEQ